MALAFKCDICGKLLEGKPVKHSNKNSKDLFLYKTHEGLDVCIICHESLQSWARHRVTEDEDYDVIRDLQIKNRDLEKDINEYADMLEARDEQIEDLQKQLREARGEDSFDGADPPETVACIKMGR